MLPYLCIISLSFSHTICVLVRADFPVDPIYQAFLVKARYIEELQKFMEDDLYKQSVQLESPEAIAAERTPIRSAQSATSIYSGVYCHFLV